MGYLPVHESVERATPNPASSDRQPWPQQSGMKRADSGVVTTQAREGSSRRCEWKNPTSLPFKYDEQNPMEPALANFKWPLTFHHENICQTVTCVLFFIFVSV